MSTEDLIRDIRDCGHTYVMPIGEAARRCPFCGAISVNSGPWALPHLVAKVVRRLDETPVSVLDPSATTEPAIAVAAEAAPASLATVPTKDAVTIQQVFEDSFPETVVHMHLDGTQRKYIPVDGEELREMLERARCEEREACIALLYGCHPARFVTEATERIRARGSDGPGVAT